MSTEYLDFSGYTIYTTVGEELWLEDFDFNLVHTFTRREALQLRTLLNLYLDGFDGQDSNS